jgi:isopentenyldiphosphate isomerase
MTNPAEEILDVVDENDNVTGQATRAEIHANGLKHRAVHVFLFNAAGEIYIHRRSANKDRHPRLLDSSAAGHLDSGETYDSAAVRELSEELHVHTEVEQVLKVVASDVTDQEHVILYRALSDEHSLPEPDPSEIEWGTFVAADRLTKRMEEHPEDFVPAFIYLWKEYQKIAT